MDTKALVAAIALAGVLGSSVSLAHDGDADRSHPADFIKDSAITAKIKSRLAVDHLTSLAKIHVDTDADGVVWLSGKAKSAETISQAERIARNTEHVRDVHNDIRLSSDD